MKILSNDFFHLANESILQLYDTLGREHYREATQYDVDKTPHVVHQHVWSNGEHGFHTMFKLMIVAWLVGSSQKTETFANKPWDPCMYGIHEWLI